MKKIFILFAILLLTSYSFGGGKGDGGSTTPKYKEVKLTVTYYWQETSYFCGMACMQMYLDYLFTKKDYYWDYWNRKRTPTQQELWNKNVGGAMANFPSTLNYYLNFAGYGNSYTKYYIFYGDNSQLNTQKSLIDNSEVCIVGFGKTYYGSDHAVLMIGYEIKSDSSSVSDIRTIYYHDPWHGAEKYISPSKWKDYTIINDGYGTYRMSVAKAGF